MKKIIFLIIFLIQNTLFLYSQHTSEFTLKYVINIDFQKLDNKGVLFTNGKDSIRLCESNIEIGNLTIMYKDFKNSKEIKKFNFLGFDPEYEIVAIRAFKKGGYYSIMYENSIYRLNIGNVIIETLENHMKNCILSLKDGGILTKDTL